MSPREITLDERRARVVVRHRLSPAGRTDDVDLICADLVGFHSSDPTSVYLAAAARMVNPEISPVQTSMYVDRTLVRHHAMRRTLWVHPLAQARVAHTATTTRYIESERTRLVKMLEDGAGVEDGAAWLDLARSRVIGTLETSPGSSTRQLGEVLPELKLPIRLSLGKSYEGTQSALSRILLQLGFEGVVARTEPLGSWNNGQYRWELMKDWIPDGWGPVDLPVAREALVVSWLRSFGPGSERDIAWWSGLPLGVIRQALDACGAVRVVSDGQELWIDADDGGETLDPGLSVALLPGLDSTTMGWKERNWYLTPEDTKLLFDSNGNGGPTIWVNGEIVGGWVQGSDGGVRYRLTRDVGAEAGGVVEERAHTLEKLWGEIRFRVRFPAPLQKMLL